MKPITCKRCKSFRVSLSEIAETHIVHHWDDPEGTQEPGPIVRVVFDCQDCKYTYTMRGVCQVDDDLMDRLNLNKEAHAAAQPPQTNY